MLTYLVYFDGATGVRWVDEDGTDRGGFDFPPTKVRKP